MTWVTLRMKIDAGPDFTWSEIVPTSFPFLQIAREENLPYGVVIRVADLYDFTRRVGDYAVPYDLTEKDLEDLSQLTFDQRQMIDQAICDEATRRRRNKND